MKASSETFGDLSTNDELAGWWDLPPGANDESTELEEKQPDSPSGQRGFTLPSLATSSQPIPSDDTVAVSPTKNLSLSLDPSPSPNPVSPKTPTGPAPPSPTWVSPWAPPESKKSQSKAYGRSADIQEAPLHDSWSSHSGESTPAPKRESLDGLASAQKDSLRDSWSSEESHQDQGVPNSSWAAALKAAASEPNGDEGPFDKALNQGTEVPRPPALEDIPEEEPADRGERLENLHQPTVEPRKKGKAGRIFIGLVIVLLVLLGLGSVGPASYHYFTNKAAVPRDSNTPSTDSPPTDDATIWLASAQESLGSKDFGLAAAQLERAVSFLKEDEGEQGRLKKTQVLLATTYSKTGDYGASATVWTELAKSYPDLKKKGTVAAAAALRENRIIANKKVKAGEKAVSNKRFDKAIKVANEALDIYAVSQGQNSQMARAHGVLGDAYRGKQNSRVAFSHFTEASKLDPQGRYKFELSKLRLPGRPKPRTKPAKRPKPRFVTKSSVPQANARR